MKRPVSSFLSEKAMAWTRKSIVPQRAQRSEAGVQAVVVGHVDIDRKSDPTLAASGSTRLPKASP
jgi:hypothetical protein